MNVPSQTKKDDIATSANKTSLSRRTINSSPLPLGQRRQPSPVVSEPPSSVSVNRSPRLPSHPNQPQRRSSPFERVTTTTDEKASASPCCSALPHNLFLLDENKQSSMTGIDIFKGRRNIGSIGGMTQVFVATPQLDQLRGGHRLDIKFNESFNNKGVVKMSPMSMEIDATREDERGTEKPLPSPEKPRTPAGDDAETEDECSKGVSTPNGDNDEASSTSKNGSADDTTRPTAAAAGGNPNKHDVIFNSKISFPLNLIRMLEDAKEKKQDHIIHWGEDEKSFVIVDIDMFLKEVLPKFFKSSENTKIRSFYRKLNRWGFSMSRKRANNPNNVWSHPEFNRTMAKKALAEALEAGKAVDFLNMTTFSRGRKRRGTDASGPDSLEEEDHDLGFAQQLDASFTSNASEQPNPMDILLGGGLTRSGSSQLGFVAGNLASIASMPTLPSARTTSLTSLTKRGKLGPGLPSRQSNHLLSNQGGQQRRLLSHSATATNLTSARSSMGQRPSSNATFDLITNPQRRSSGVFDSLLRPNGPISGTGNSLSQPQRSSGVFDSMLRPSGSISGTGNALFNLLPSLSRGGGGGEPLLAGGGMGPGMGGGNSNATFDLPSTRLGGMMMNSSNRTGPSTNIFAMSAQEMLAAHSTPRPASKNNIFLSNLGMVNASSNNISTPTPFPRREVLQSEMTKEEDNELTKFFGNFAETLPPPQEDDGDDDGEPDPLPDDVNMSMM